MKLSDFPKIIIATSRISSGNMSFARGDESKVLKNREKFLNSCKVSSKSVVVMHTQHGNQIMNVGKKQLERGAYRIENAVKVDALITNETNINLFLLTADCLPISLYDSKNKAIGLIHAGWRGLDLGIINNTIKMMQAEFGTKPNNLLAYIGPSIGPCCYKNSLTFAQKDDPKWQPFILRENDSFCLDLWSFANNQLEEAGILSENIENPKICTYHSGKYFSHHWAEDEKSSRNYRFATILGLK